METRFIETAKIVVPEERRRQDLGDIDELRASITAVGQLQPIGVTPDNVLVWGHRRFVAIHEDPERAPKDRRIWVAIFKGDPNDQAAAHRAENACQHALHWEDRAYGHRREVERRVAVAESAGGRRGEEREGAGRPKKGEEEIEENLSSIPVVTEAAVAESLGVPPPDFYQDLFLADALRPELMPAAYRKERFEKHPELQFTPEQQTSLKAQKKRNAAIAKRKEICRHNERTAAIAAAEEGLPKTGETAPLILGDCFEWFETAEPESVDLVVTDPPFGISSEGAQTFKDGAPASGHFGAWDAHSRADEEALLAKLFAGISKVLVIGGSWYVFMARDYLGIADRLAESVGLKPRTTIAWIKPNPPPNIRGGYANAWEAILYGQKGTNPVWTAGGDEKESVKNWIQVAPPRGDRIHPTEKPVELLKHFIVLSSNEDSVVLDPFAGSGATCAAAAELGRSWIGIEKDKGAWTLACKRLRAALKGGANG